MARWQPRTPQESLQVSLERIKSRIDAKKAYYIRFPGGAESFSLSWPAVANFSIYKGGYPWLYYWVDSSAAPLKRS